MKIGVCIIFESMDGMREKVQMMKDENFDNCQIISWYPSLWTKDNAHVLKELFEKNGITVSAFWCGWEGPRLWNFYDGPVTLGLVPREYRAMRMKNLCDGADFAKILGVTDIATHMGFIPEDPNDPNFNSFCNSIRFVAAHLKKNDQYLLFETGQETPVTMLRCFETIGADNLGVNFDTANLLSYGKGNPVDALGIIGKWVRGVHAKDGKYPSDGKKTGGEVLMGTGLVDFDSIFEKLHALGYDGYITIEREITGEQQIKDIREARKFLQPKIDRACRK